MRRARFALAGLAALLMLLAIAESLMPDSAKRVMSGAAWRAAPASPRDAAPALRLVGRQVAAITARPLFRPDRRPAAAVQAHHNTRLPRLSGILIGAGLRLAIFTDDSGKTRMARQGDMVHAYRISRISAGHVTLTASGVRMVLTPRFAKMAGITLTPVRPPPLHPPMPQFQMPGKK